MSLRVLPLLIALLLLGASTSQARLVSGPSSSLPSQPSTVENASTAFFEGGSESRIGLLCHNDPINKSDPTGLYGQGFGWTKSGWEDFQKRQDAAIQDVSNRLNNMTKESFEKQFGKGTATPENMARKAGELRAVLNALKDNGSKGYYANAVTTAYMKSVNAGEANGAAYPSDRKSIYINAEKAFNPHVIKHEAAHNAGLVDSVVNGHNAYRDGTPAERLIYSGLPQAHPDRALMNADTLADYAQ